MTHFEDSLKSMGIKPSEYIGLAKRFATKAGYEPKYLTFSSAEGKKLSYKDVDFGNSDYKDFIIYQILNGDDEALKNRQSYLARARKIPGDWKTNPLSRNRLAISIIWAGSV